MTRRSFIKKITGTFIASIVAGGGGYYYAREVETKLLDINYYNITHPLIPSEFDQFKIIQFSDTHLGFQYTMSQLKKLVNKINKLEPDIVVFTGDLMDEPNKFRQSEDITPILLQIKAPFGKFAIYGNHDHGGYGTDLYREIIENSGFVLLQNEGQEVQLLNGSSINVIGLDDAMLGSPDLDTAMQGVSHETYNILLAHEPDIAQLAIGRDIHLQLSGHSHGGQVQIPFVGALVTPPYGEMYYEGFYKLGDHNDQLTLYVNRGLGTTRLPFRFLSKPELTVFTLKSSK